LTCLGIAFHDMLITCESHAMSCHQHPASTFSSSPHAMPCYFHFFLVSSFKKDLLLFSFGLIFGRKLMILRTRRTERLLPRSMLRSEGQRQTYAMNFPNSRSLQIARFCQIHEIYSTNIVLCIEIASVVLLKEPN
jgi:hypothetical protein